MFLQIIDPQAFAGLGEFTRQTGFVTEQCLASRPARTGRPVRLPGERGLQLAAAQREEGVALYPSIMPSLEPWCRKLGVAMPQPRAAAR